MCFNFAEDEQVKDVRNSCSPSFFSQMDSTCVFFRSRYKFRSPFTGHVAGLAMGEGPTTTGFRPFHRRRWDTGSVSKAAPSRAAMSRMNWRSSKDRPCTPKALAKAEGTKRQLFEAKIVGRNSEKMWEKQLLAKTKTYLDFLSI